MKRFNFRLDQVRKWRQDQAELEEMRLQQLYSELRVLEARRKSIAAEADISRRKLVAQQSVTAEELSFLEAFRAYANEQIRQLSLKEREMEVRIKEQRRLLMEAHRRFQLLDGLRDKAMVTWTAACDKEQEEVAAELFLAKRNRTIDRA